MSGGVELDLVCAEIDADELCPTTKLKSSQNLSLQEKQVFEVNDDDDDDEIAIIEPVHSNGQTQSEIIIENQAKHPTVDVKVDSDANGKHRKSERTTSSSSSSSTTSITSSNSSHTSANDCNGDEIDSDVQIESLTSKTKSSNGIDGNNYRKSNAMPTLMITVKNDIAQTNHDQTVSTNDAGAETATLRHIFSDASYFLIKSINEENISIAKTKGVWSTPSANEQKLNRAFREHRNVILIFSVAESKGFQGFARMSSEARHDGEQINWVLPPGMRTRAFTGVIHIDWITRRSLLFSRTGHLFNSWNENKPVKIGRDGQQIEPRCAEALCRLFPSDSSIDIMSIARKAKLNKKRPSSRSQSHSPLPNDRSTNVPIQSSSVIIKSQTSKEPDRHASNNVKQRSKTPTDDNDHHHHRYRHRYHRSSSSHNRHRYQRSRSRERIDADSSRKRRRRSNSSHSDRNIKLTSNRKHTHRHKDDYSSHNSSNKSISKIISNGTYEEYMSHLFASHAQYGAFPAAIFPPGGYPMNYDPNYFYPTGYDHRGMSMHAGGYDMPVDMYMPQSTSHSSRTRNSNNYEQEISAFLHHTTSNLYPTNDNSSKSHRNHRYPNKLSSRHDPKTHEHRR